MKKKYVVGFFLALFCMVLLVSAGYAASCRYVMQRLRCGLSCGWDKPL